MLRYLDKNPFCSHLVFILLFLKLILAKKKDNYQFSALIHHSIFLDRQKRCIIGSLGEKITVRSMHCGTVIDLIS